MYTCLLGRVGRREGILDGRGRGEVVEGVPERVAFPAEPGACVLQLQQRLLFPGRPFEGAPDEEREGGREEVAAEVHDALLLGLAIEPVGDADDVAHIVFDLGGEGLKVVALGRTRRRAVLEPGDLSDEVGFGAEDAGDAEPLLALADEKEAVVDEALVLDDLADAADVGDGASVREDDAEAKVGLQQGVHQDAVAELEDLEREDGAREEDERQRKEGQLDEVVGEGSLGRRR